ncbi:hypothetical protein QL285_042692 [Trifolium repens]|nr:hypothetical protein QL285_042692 [Trifolium repens]
MPKSSNFAHSQQLCRREVFVDQNKHELKRERRKHKEAEVNQLAKSSEKLRMENAALKENLKLLSEDNQKR